MVPIGDVKRRIAPLGFAGSLDRAVRSGHNPDNLAVGLEIYRGCPSRRIAAVEVLDKSDVAGSVAADQIFVPIFVPVETAGRDKRAELEHVGLLLKKLRR